MIEWSEDHVAAISPLNLNLGIFGRIGLNKRMVRRLWWKVETTGWEGQGVVCGKSAPLRL
jgi:hypothetical protein